MGELSPKVTERASQPLLNDMINLSAYLRKMPVNIIIGEPQHFQSQPRQELRTFGVICQCLGIIMLRTVKFNDQFGGSTVKVHDESADNPLLEDFHRIFAQKEIPELALMGCHLSA